MQKHAGATRVAVSLEKTDSGLEISVDDNGHGFTFAGTYSWKSSNCCGSARPA